MAAHGKSYNSSCIADKSVIPKAIYGFQVINLERNQTQLLLTSANARNNMAIPKTGGCCGSGCIADRNIISNIIYKYSGSLNSTEVN
jgi:hypothetical protein